MPELAHTLDCTAVSYKADRWEQQAPAAHQPNCQSSLWWRRPVHSTGTLLKFSCSTAFILPG